MIPQVLLVGQGTSELEATWDLGGLRIVYKVDQDCRAREASLGTGNLSDGIKETRGHEAELWRD